MQGMPFIDMAYLKKEQVRNGCITYQRRKTNRQLRVKIHPQAQIIIDRYMVSDPGCPYLFPILYDPEKRQNGSIRVPCVSITSVWIAFPPCWNWTSR